MGLGNQVEASEQYPIHNSIRIGVLVAQGPVVGNHGRPQCITDRTALPTPRPTKVSEP